MSRKRTLLNEAEELRHRQSVKSFAALYVTTGSQMYLQKTACWLRNAMRAARK